jgi:hypothetical protein
MVAYEDDTRSVDDVMSKVGAFVGHDWDSFHKNPDSLVLEFLGYVKALANEEQAIKLRIAQELAWAKGKDVGEAGCPNWTAFLTEHSPWRPSRSRDYLRLVESKLDLIKEAVSKNEIDVTMATRAPRLIGDAASEEEQQRWLNEATFASTPAWHRAFQDVLTGEEMRRVLRGRALAQILVGWRAPAAAVDAFMLDCLEKKLTGEQILERARAAPPKPERLGKKPPEWTNAPTLSILDPWVEPRNVEESAERLGRLNVLLDQREMLLAQAYFLIKFHALWTSVEGCESLTDLCVRFLHLSQQTFQRYARRGLDVFQNPEVVDEVNSGRIGLDKASLAMDRARDGAIAPWLELVRRLGRVELAHAQERHAALLLEYKPAVEMAKDVESIVQKAKEGGMGAAADQASTIGGPASRIAEHLLAVGATGEIQVAVRDDANRRSPPPEPEFIFAPPNLLAAADYLLAQVDLPRFYGPKQMVEHDMHICQNPRCRTPTLRLQPHHMKPRHLGGSDDPANLLGLCPACHQRGVHKADWLDVVRIDDWIVFTWRDGSATVMYSPVAWARKAVQKWM